MFWGFRGLLVLGVLMIWVIWGWRLWCLEFGLILNSARFCLRFGVFEFGILGLRVCVYLVIWLG